MLHYGHKHLTPLFYFNLINGLLTIPIIILTLPLMPYTNIALLSPSLSLLLLEIYFFIFLLIQFFIHLTPYAIITDQLTTLQAIKKTKSLIWHNKINTVLILIIIPLLSGLITLPFYLLIYLTTQTWLLLYIIIYSITLPLSTLWFTQYYQQLSKK